VIQGGGNMPAYGKNLSPAETTALVAFLETLHPAGQAPARDASRAVNPEYTRRRHDHIVHTGMSELPVTVTLSCGLALVYARLVSASQRSSKCGVGVAAGSVHGRTVFTVGRRGVSSRRLDHQLLTLHMAQHLLLDDRGGSVDSAGSAGDHAAVWPAAALRSLVF
jgi:hypothetical protein